MFSDSEQQQDQQQDRRSLRYLAEHSRAHDTAASGLIRGQRTGRQRLPTANTTQPTDIRWHRSTWGNVAALT
jgi:hypothetical protein